MQIDRLFQIVHILLDKKKVTAKELAETFEVSSRTIYRDIDTLSMAGIPVYTNKGKGGGISLLDSFVMNKSVLSNEEQNKILVGLEILKATEYENVDNSITKLKALFNKSNENWIEVDFSSWGSLEVEKKKFEDLKYVLTNCMAVKFNYRNMERAKSTRMVYPLKLQFKDKAWYLIAYCLLKEDYRVFKVNRIDNLQIVDKTFDRDDYRFDGIDLSFQQLNKLIEIKIVLSSVVKFRVFDEFNFHNIKSNDDGSFEVTFHTSEDDWIISYLVSFGEHVKIIEPVYLRKKMLDKLEKILKANK